MKYFIIAFALLVASCSYQEKEQKTVIQCGDRFHVFEKTYVIQGHWYIYVYQFNHYHYPDSLVAAFPNEGCVVTKW